jgi:hypothetical protein
MLKKELISVRIIEIEMLGRYLSIELTLACFINKSDKKKAAKIAASKKNILQILLVFLGPGIAQGNCPVEYRLFGR